MGSTSKYLINTTIFKTKDGIIAVKANHVFADNTERDAYFLSNPSELTEPLFIISAGILQEFNGNTWDIATGLIKGDKGKEVELQKSVTHVQWRYIGDATWTDLVLLSDLKGDNGATGSNGADGTDGREVELLKGLTHIQWRYTGDVAWADLVALVDLKGEKGDTGERGAAFTFDATGLLVDLSTYDAEDKDFTFLATDTGNFYIKQSNTSGDWSDPIPFKGDKGDKGDIGETGNNGADGREIEMQKTTTHVQWRYVGDVVWADLVALSELKGDIGATGAQGLQGVDGADGADGKEVELQKDLTHIQWRYTGDVAWTDLAALADLKGEKGDTGATGAAGADGTSFSVDATGLLATITTYDAELKGFVFLATDTGNLYIKQSATSGDWSSPIPFKGDKGDTGEQGLQGIQGIQGVKGDKGDTGAAGADGTNGIDGNVWRNGSGVPSDALGADNDYYLDNDTGNVYKRVTGAYGIVANIKGATGSSGADGTAGTNGTNGVDGTDGADGATWTSGTSAPSGGADGDFYLKTDTYDVYKNISGTWNVAANIKGAKGDTGEQGIQGIQGEVGPQGEIGPQGMQGAQGIKGDTGATGAKGDTGDAGKEVEFQKSATYVQWRYIGDVAWTDLVALSEISGTDGADGTNGKEVELQKGLTHIQYRYVGDVSWIDIVAVADLKGDTGAQGIQGIQGIKGDTGATGANGSDATVNATNIGAVINAAEAATPNDTDLVATAEASGSLKKITWTSIKSFLKTYFDTLYSSGSGLGDMLLDGIQNVTGLKTFDKDKLAMKGTSTGTNIISVANTSATNYTNTLPAKDGTFAMTSDITGTNSGTNTGDETTTRIGTLINGSTEKTTPVDADMLGLMDSGSSNILKKLSWANIKTTLLTWIQATSFTLLQYKQAQTTVQTLTSAATITPDWNSGQIATLTLGINATLANPTNLKSGTTMQIKITQDATGSRTLAYGTNYKWATGADKTLSTAANAVDILTLSCFDGTNIYCTLLKAFA